jgi:hypothetical protein
VAGGVLDNGYVTVRFVVVVVDGSSQWYMLLWKVRCVCICVSVYFVGSGHLRIATGENWQLAGHAGVVQQFLNRATGWQLPARLLLDVWCCGLASLDGCTEGCWP